MPEWQKDQKGDTRGYAFLMLAEGAIHGILRSAKARGVPAGREIPGSAPAGISPSWSGTYDGRFTIQLRIDSWSGQGFTGVMTYPDEGTTTSVDGTAKDEAAGVRLTWDEDEYLVQGRRVIEFDGTYAADIRDRLMKSTCYRNNRRIADFTMTPTASTAGVSAPAEPRTASR